MFPCPCAVYMYEIMILLNNFSSATTWPIFTKFYVDPTIETGWKVCSNGHALSYTVKKKSLKNTFFFFKTKNCSDDPFISCNDKTGKMLHNMCISAVTVSLR